MGQILGYKAGVIVLILKGGGVGNVNDIFAFVEPRGKSYENSGEG